MILVLEISNPPKIPNGAEGPYKGPLAKTPFSQARNSSVGGDRVGRGGVQRTLDMANPVCYPLPLF